jgi:polynucleotide 5'-kinase involved in rRNA processing
VSTYRLDVEDIIEVLQDIVVVQEDAASRKQRLTKGLWDAQFDSEYPDVEDLESSSDRRRRRRNNRSNRKKRDLDDEEWDIFR